MATVTVHAVRAFTRGGVGGNLAGVVLDADELDEAAMQRVAAEVGYSETAFLLAPTMPGAEHHVRFFAPSREVDLCGHATIATFGLMASLGRLGCGPTNQQTKADPEHPLALEVGEDGTIYMEQMRPVFGDAPDRAAVAAALGVAADVLVHDVAVVSTGLRKIHASVVDLEALGALAVDRERVIALSEAHDVTGIYVSCLVAGDPTVVARCRNFAPIVGIEEDSATGTSVGGLACKLHREGLLPADRDPLDDLVFHQGDALGQPSELRARIVVDPSTSEVAGIRVGGAAVPDTTLEIEIETRSGDEA